MSNTFGRMIKGSLLFTLGSVTANILGALSTIILARLLTPADYGIFAIGATVIAILSSVTDWSIGQALIQRNEVDDDHVNTAWTLNFLRVVPIGIGLMLLSPLIAASFDDPRLTDVLIALAAGWMLMGFVSPKIALFQRQLQFGQQVLINVSQKLVSVVVTIVIAILYKSYWALVIGTLSASVVTMAISYVIAPFIPRFTLKHGREIFSFSAWASLGEIVNTLNWRIDALLIGKFLNVHDIGYYTVGSNLALLPTREAITPLTKTLFPGFSSIRNDPDRLRSAYSRAQNFVTAVSLPVGVGVALLGDPIVRVLLGERWLPAIFIVQTLSLIFSIQTLGTQVGPLAMAMGETRMLFRRSIELLFIRLPIVVAGLYIAGIKGMVVARLIAGIIAIGINLRMVKRLLGLSIWSQLRANERAIASTAIMAGCVLAAQTITPHSMATFALILQILQLSALGAVVYCASSYLLWTIAGRPAGPETDALHVFNKILTRVRLVMQR
jgi:lipopolysaccharide exporter